MKKFILLIASLILFGLVSTVQAQIEQITLRVDGLACPFCAYGVEKKLKKLEGVSSLDIHINVGKVILQWKAGKPLRVLAISEAVDKSGFTLRGIKGRFVGTIREEDGRHFLLLPQSAAQRLYLYDSKLLKDPSHNAVGSSNALAPATRQRLQNLALENQKVRIIGSVHGHKDPDQLLALEIESLETINP